MDKDKCGHKKAKLQNKKENIYKCVRCGQRIKVKKIGEINFAIFLEK